MWVWFGCWEIWCRRCDGCECECECEGRKRVGEGEGRNSYIDGSEAPNLKADVGFALSVDRGMVAVDIAYKVDDTSTLFSPTS